MNFTQSLIAMFLVSAGFYIGYFAYECLSMDVGVSPEGWRLWAYFRSFWSIAYIAPFPGGQSSLQSMRVQEPGRLRACQISGLQLLILSVVFQRIFLYWWQAGSPSNENSLWINPPSILEAPSVFDALNEVQAGKSYLPVEMWWSSLIRILKKEKLRLQD